MTCRCCGLKGCRERTYTPRHRDVCSRCHDYLYCNGQRPRNQWSRFFDEETAEALAEKRARRKVAA